MTRKKGGTYGLRRPILYQCMMTLVALSLAIAPPLDAADVSEYRLKAEFIERLTRFIEWPDEAPFMRDPDAPFVIAVVGKDPFGSHLDELARRHVIKGRKVVTKRLTSGDDVTDCSIVFISRSERDSLERIVSQTRGRPILTIADTSGFARRGVIINFFEEDNRIQFEINEGAADASGLDIRGKLYKLARIVNEDDQASTAVSRESTLASRSPLSGDADRERRSRTGHDAADVRRRAQSSEREVP